MKLFQISSLNRIALFFSVLFATSIFAAIPPAFTSFPSVNKHTAYIGETLTFSAVATSSNGQPVTYIWDFADGTTGSGATVTHIYTAAGTSLVVQCTISDGTLTASASVVVTISAPIYGEGVDSDGDGFSDEFETEVGTNPNDATSTPLNGAPAFVENLRTIISPTLKLKYVSQGKKPNYTLSLSGQFFAINAIPLSTGGDQKVYVRLDSPDLGSGTGYSFDLSSEGTSGKSARGSITFSFAKAPKNSRERSSTPPKGKFKATEKADDDDEEPDDLTEAYVKLLYKLQQSKVERKAQAGQPVTLNLFVTYGGHVYQGVIRAVITEDMKGTYTLTSTK